MSNFSSQLGVWHFFRAKTVFRWLILGYRQPPTLATQPSQDQVQTGQPKSKVASKKSPTPSCDLKIDTVILLRQFVWDCRRLVPRNESVDHGKGKVLFSSLVAKCT